MHNSLIEINSQVFFDVHGCDVIVCGEVRPLTAREYHILLKLVEEPDEYHTSGALTDYLQNDDNDIDERGVVQAIYTLRRKLNDCGRKPRILVTRRAIGYRILLSSLHPVRIHSEITLK